MAFQNTWSCWKERDCSNTLKFTPDTSILQGAFSTEGVLVQTFPEETMLSQDRESFTSLIFRHLIHLNFTSLVVQLSYELFNYLIIQAFSLKISGILIQ